MPNDTPKPQPTELGDLLRLWRGRRGKSQFDLSIETGISQRHLSFIESGRASPSRETLIAIADGLDVPLRERNALLLTAGYAPIYSESAWDAPQMQRITDALWRMLHQHEPYPAVVLDRYWNVVMANDAAPRFFNLFIDMAKRPKPRNLLHLMFDPDGMRPFIADWDVVAKSLLQRVQRESIGRIVDAGTKELVSALLAYPDVRSDCETFSDASVLPLIPIGFVKDGRLLRYFSMVTTVGTPQSVAAQELRLECMFPADDDTEAAHTELMQRAA